MRLFDVQGRLVSKNVSKYLINWSKPSRSKLQFRVKQFLKSYWQSHIVYEEFPVYGTLQKVDILNATLKIAIEVMGEQHSDYHFFHGKSPTNYLKSIKNDYRKVEWLSKNNFKFVEINYDEINLLSREFFRDKFNVTL